MTLLNRPPGGSPSPNVITVGGTTKCEPNRIAELASGRGPLIEIVAPTEMVPFVKVEDASDFHSGTSFATPQVTSLAAIMKSIDYTLSPAKIKEYITTNVFSAVDEEGRLYPRLNYYLPVAQLLMDTNPKPEILDIIASYDDPSQYVNVGEAALRKCSGLYYAVEDYGTHYYTGEEGEINEEIIGQITESGWSLFATSDDAYLNSSCFDCNFEIKKGFPINQEAQSTPETVGVSFTYMLSQDSSPNGTGIEGEFRFVSCRIVERHYLTQSPWYVAMEGKFEGILEILDEEYQPEPLIERGFSGNYNLLFINMAAGQQSSINEYLEDVCNKEG